MDNIDLTTRKIEKELEELIGESKGEVESQEPEMVLLDVEDNAKKGPKIKKEFVPLSKDDFEKLGRRGQLAYKIELSKNRTEQLKKEYQDFKTKQTKADKSAQTKRLIIMGRFLDIQLHKRSDRKVQYMVVKNHLDQYLTENSDRQLLGFPLLEQPSEDHHDRN